MSDLIESTQRMAESHGLEFRDCGGGHVQVRGNGVLVNYWPISKRQTAHCPETGESVSNCTPYNAIKLAMKGRSGSPPRPKAHREPSKKGPLARDIEPKVTNSSGLVHFHDGDMPPWDESLGEFRFYGCDGMRHHAWQLEQTARKERADADWIEGRLA